MGLNIAKQQYPNQEVYERSGFKCVYCGIDGSRDFETFFTANFSVDHVKPKSRCGTNAPENLVLACHSCNLYKRDFNCNSVEEGKAIIRQTKQIARNWYEKFVLRHDLPALRYPLDTQETSSRSKRSGRIPQSTRVPPKRECRALRAEIISFPPS
jgi:hypothetical protein